MPDAPSFTDSPDIQVRVEVLFMPSHSQPGRLVFAYIIHIENRSDQTWKLLARHWDIVDGLGRETSVDGEGVVGEQPVLPPGGSFTYDSFVTVEATPGRMGGHYVMQDAWGVHAHVPIPAFVLDVPGARVLN